MPLISGELLGRAFLTKSLISSSFKGESSNFSSGGCGRLGSLRRLNGVSMSGSVYFFRRCASKSPFGILRTPFFSPSKNFLENLNRFFSKLDLAFRFFCRRFLPFSALAMTRIFSLTSDNCFFINSRSFGISLIRFLRSLCSTLSQPFSRCLLLAVRMSFSFWTSSAPKCSRQTAGIVLVKECSFTPIDPLKLFRRIKDTSSSRTFYLSSFALGQLMQIGFPFTLGALG